MSPRNDSYAGLLNDGTWKAFNSKTPTIAIKMDIGVHEKFCRLRDKWQNDVVIEPLRLIVVPTWALLPFAAIVPAALCILALALAPYSRYCHLLLMNPFIRKWGSFGAVQMVLTAIPLARRHVFKRYCRGLASDQRFRHIAENYVVPCDEQSPAGFSDVLERHSALAVLGPSGIGKSTFLVSIAAYSASHRDERSLLSRLIPVFVDLNVTANMQPLAMIGSQLRKHGDLNDAELVDT